jgi:hypothetical protein
MLDAVVGWLPKAVVAIILIVVGSAIAKVVKDLITGAIGGLSYGRFVASLASVAIIAVFAIAALTQIGIAAAVTQPILITVLATIGAILAIGVGGGLIKPMQGRWERMLNVAEQETTRHVAAYQAGRQHAMQSPASQSTTPDQATPAYHSAPTPNPTPTHPTQQGPGEPSPGQPV